MLVEKYRLFVEPDRVAGSVEEALSPIIEVLAIAVRQPMTLGEPPLLRAREERDMAQLLRIAGHHQTLAAVDENQVLPSVGEQIADLVEKDN